MGSVTKTTTTTLEYAVNKADDSTEGCSRCAGVSRWVEAVLVGIYWMS